MWTSIEEIERNRDIQIFILVRMILEISKALRGIIWLKGREDIFHNDFTST